MRRRSTFLHGKEHAIAPSDVSISNHSIEFSGLKAVREDRWTASLYELPQEIWILLKNVDSLHIRWVSPEAYQAVSPFNARLPSGLHIFLSPSASKNRNSDVLCPILSQAFSLKAECTSFQDKFTSDTLEHSSASSSTHLQYYEPTLPDVPSILSVYIRQKWCGRDGSQCANDAASISVAKYIDIDYNALTQSFSLSVFLPEQPDPSDERTTQITDHDGQVMTEVGFLGEEAATESGAISLGGFLVSIGPDSKPKSTLFSFPARHHSLPALSNETYTADITKPTGLHPRLRLSFSGSILSPGPSCALHTYINLPSSIFADQYQLSSTNFLASNNLRALRGIHGYMDLEAPDWAVIPWGSSLLLEMAVPESASDAWHADIPLHLRYLRPPKDLSTDYTLTNVAWPAVFWACPINEGTKMDTSPFDRVHLGYDSMFGERTAFFHLQPQGQDELVETIVVPTLDHESAMTIELGTMGFIILGLVWLCWNLWQASLDKPDHVNRSKKVD